MKKSLGHRQKRLRTPDLRDRPKLTSGFCDDSTKPFVIKGVTMGGKEGQKLSKIA